MKIEERPPEGVTGYGDNQWASKDVKARNPAFDLTTAGLITVLISEEGVVYKPDSNKISNLFKE